MAYSLPNLPYDYDTLEPYIDSATMELHHSKHHQAYVDKLNSALEGTKWAENTIEGALQNLDKLPPNIQNVVRNNGGGHYNHSLFWQMMLGKPTKPSVSLEECINKTFTTFDNFKDKFSEAAIGRFGSGWAWLTYENDELKISSTPNQDSPIMNGIRPLLGLDVWEHAYYLKYQNRRPEYIENWWNVVNWEFISQEFEKVRDK